jgi:superfamily II DNA helicase RecQ
MHNTAPPSILSYPPNGDENCKQVFGFIPKAEQRKVAEHIGRGEDVILIAGCGWGKTLAYFLPLVLWENRVVVVISPLVALMEEQHMKLQAVNINSIPICSGRLLPHNLEEELISGKYRAVFMSPEAAFNKLRFEKLWNDAGWRSKLLAVVIDEAHCISTWGPEFRTDYSRIGDLRSNVPPGTAFVAVSATLHGQILQDVKRNLHFEDNVTVIKADTDRPNVRYEVRVSNGDISTCYKALEEFMDSKKTIVYFDKGDHMSAAYIHLMSSIRDSSSGSLLPDQIVKYYADLAPETKLLYMSKLKRGEIRMMLSTEAAGMGCDISDILRVVQFKFPANITAIAQRLGRAARDPNLQGYGILIYPRTDASQLNSMEDDLREYITTDCRRKHFNKVFENRHKIVANCCDLCDPEISPRTRDFRIVRKTRPMLSRTFKVVRLPEQRLAAKEKIMKWRTTELQELRKQAAFYDERCIMDEGAINLLSERFGDIAIVEDISAIVDWSELVQGSKQRLANILIEFNSGIENQLSSTSLDNESIGRLVRSVHREEAEKSARKNPDLQSDTHRKKRRISTRTNKGTIYE